MGRDISSQFFYLLPSKTFGTRLKARLSVKFKGKAYGLHPAHYFFLKISGSPIRKIKYRKNLLY